MKFRMIDYDYEMAQMKIERRDERRGMKITDVLLNGTTRDKSRIEAVIWFSNGDRHNYLYGTGIPEKTYFELGKLAKSSYKNIRELARVQEANRILDLFHCA